MSVFAGLRRAWRRSLAAGSILLLAALLPSLLYFDHWQELYDHTFGHVEETELAEHTTHAMHCHAGPASCADQPVALKGEGFGTIVEVPHVDLPAVLLEEHRSRPQEFVLLLLPDPPRA